MDFFKSAIGVLQTFVIALGAGPAVWGAINQRTEFYSVFPGTIQTSYKICFSGYLYDFLLLYTYMLWYTYVIKMSAVIFPRRRILFYEPSGVQTHRFYSGKGLFPQAQGGIHKRRVVSLNSKLHSRARGVFINPGSCDK